MTFIGVGLVLVATLPIMLFGTEGTTYRAMEFYRGLYDSGEFLALNSSFFGLFLNLFLPPAPRYVREVIPPCELTKEEKDVRENK